MDAIVTTNSIPSTALFYQTIKVAIASTMMFTSVTSSRFDSRVTRELIDQLDN